MPVNRLNAELVISIRHRCHLLCNARYREKQMNINTKSCRCESKKSEILPMARKKCNGSPDFICVAIVNNRSICLCPLTKISPRSFLNLICEKSISMNGGLCVPYDHRISLTDLLCTCPNGFSGRRCEHKDTKITLSFSGVSIPESLLVHFITNRKFNVYSIYPASVRATMSKKIEFNQDIVTLFTSFAFQFVFVQIEHHFYLTVLQHNYIPATVVSTEISQS
ncbi:unnamed protein product [Rotaria magnacalcarata]|uniref:EGF-like domain-containing protein n=1 Tax=Rotaria magnacalcarata TaxID=392030 RepID=A0A819G9E3_9BILA|nr:unnamed protein product [Rotaria magnacalcarata]CAF1928602.1 unnamed protein product [Rotaria magnacalcarata]CAF2069571.1 unnamed protein product [Rotaria magnacalcarata]CAF3881885.1 unnamed protein product [Rotaria magnacalcarata]CAF3967695.1 unnamed protein product [Rotaria magnacalcarata]